MSNNNKIQSLSQFMDYIETNQNRKLTLFRGQNVDEPLIPRLGRLELVSELREVEKAMFKEFKNFSLPFLSIQPANDWDWIALAQHHGLATRLLDWTENPLIALWFAVNKPSVVKKDGSYHNGVVWVFEPQTNHFRESEYEDPFSVERTKVFQPRHITDRIPAQSGWFTVHKYMEKSQGFIKMETNKKYKKFLKKLIIPKESFPELRSALNKCNINAATVYADIDGLCSQIQWKHSYLSDEDDVLKYVALTLDTSTT